MRQRELIIKRFALGPLAQWGFVAGVIVACLPAFLCSWVFFNLVASVRGIISSWRDVGIDVLGQRISFNLVQVLNLEDVLQASTNIAGFGIFGIFLVALLLAALLGLFGAIVLTIIGLFYNTTGRLKIEVEEVQGDAALA